MILTGSKYVNAEMKLETGDRFRVRIQDDAPNSTAGMARQNGKWQTVARRSNQKSQLYSGYYYSCREIDYSWYWFHMDAIEKAENMPLENILQMKVSALPEF